jgi:hypothetical protein
MGDVSPTLLTIALALRSGEAAPAQKVAAKVADMLQKMETAVEPVFGPRGVAALVERSLLGAAASHPWLAEARNAHGPPKERVNLEQTLGLRTADEAGAAGSDILHAFHDVLVSLVGQALTWRLVGSTWSELLDGPPLGDVAP